MESIDKVDTTDSADIFFANEAEAFFNFPGDYFQVKKAVAKDAEIQVSSLPFQAQKLFLQPGGSREKEWKNMINATTDIGGPAVKVHRGQKARELRKRYSHRLIPSRWHEKWKDMGDGFDNGLQDPNVAKHLGAKSRWILQGFHDPDIAILNRSVPTPETMDVPLALQMYPGTYLGWRRAGSFHTRFEESQTRAAVCNTTTWRSSWRR